MGTTNSLTVYNIDGIQGMPPRVDRNRVADLLHARPDLFVHTGTVDNYYNSHIVSSRRITQTVTSGYMQADTRITSKLQMLAGARFENTFNQFHEWNPRLAADVISAGHTFNRATGRATTIEGLQYQYLSRPRITRESEYHNWFPSISAKYKILPNFDWHAGWNKSISRPPIDNLTGLWTIFEEATPQPRVDAPNANLQPENSQKLQTRIAYYFGNRMPASCRRRFRR